MLNSITFIVLVKNRPKVSERLVDYLLNIKYKINILIADGSNKSQISIYKPLKRKHNLQFLKFPFDKDLRTFIEKIHKSLYSIKTKFCCLVDTDELINFEKINLMVNFLEKNKDYVLIRGRIINFELKKNNQISFIGQNYDDYGIIDINKTHKFTKSSYWEGIHRTDSLKNVFKTIIKLKIQDVYSFMDILTITGQLSGKFKFSKDFLFEFRQTNTSFFDNKNEKKNSLSQQLNYTLMYKIIEILNFIKILTLVYKKNDISNFIKLSLLQYFINIKIFHQFKNSIKYYIVSILWKLNLLQILNFKKKDLIEQEYHLSEDENNFYNKYKKFFKI